MNKEHSTSYDDRIKFVIALMKKDYAAAYDIGNQLLKYNRNDADLIKGLQTLRQLNQREIETESDSECEAADDDDSDFIIDSKGIHIDPRVANKTAPSANTPQSNDDKKTDINFKDKMYRAILIKLDEDESKKVA